MTTTTPPRDPQIPEHGLDFGFAIQVQSVLGDVALLPGADATTMIRRGLGEPALQ